MYKVPVYADGEMEVIIGRVAYNNNLDLWDGHNMCRGLGTHMGITKLRQPRNGKSFVLIHGTDWQGARDYGVLVSDERALQEILKAGEDDLLQKYFPDYEDLEEI